jgi:gluconate 5-dehydrogenase
MSSPPPTSDGAPAAVHDLLNVAGLHALVTGSSRGIGRALAEGLLSAGVHVTLNGRDGATLEAAATELRESPAAASGAVVATAAFDVTDAGDVAAGIAAIEADRPLDVLVNNAGMQIRGSLAEYQESDWNRILAVNLTSAFLVGREVARRMIPRGAGKIVNIGSLQSEVARPGIAPYAATKGGLKMLTKGMCADWAGSGLQVNSLGPGYIVTELTKALHEDESFDRWVCGRTPAARWGQVEDLVGTLLYLVSPAADFVNGQVVHVDGGMLTVL